MSVSGAAAEGTIVGSVFHPDEPRPEVRRFSERFTERYRVPPDWAAAAAYDAVHLLTRAMQEARSSEPGDVAKALHAARDWPGVTGTFTFNEAGDAIDRHLVKLVVRHGRFEHLPDPAQGVVAAIEAPRRP
jgi:branched-chain amino acid transport system substrate-binding protein